MRRVGWRGKQGLIVAKTFRPGDVFVVKAVTAWARGAGAGRGGEVVDAVVGARDGALFGLLDIWEGRRDVPLAAILAEARELELT